MSIIRRCEGRRWEALAGKGPRRRRAGAAQAAQLDAVAVRVHPGGAAKRGDVPRRPRPYRKRCLHREEGREKIRTSKTISFQRESDLGAVPPSPRLKGGHSVTLIWQSDCLYVLRPYLLSLLPGRRFNGRVNILPSFLAVAIRSFSSAFVKSTRYSMAALTLLSMSNASMA